ncbi:PREDICTED: protection of telomeres protein 1a-like isoform X1 [Nicotiana attenuata]|uniref:protection of telomeres protein 1a-like isoform X1 n=1 Tax=Nicotiana attenuata TaxID=49451 RepID=UPI00090541FC|nr:PREDICTED: protection of telomeres protein 1a-like isoform X1 [Nicotiana attenuata]XP_019244825.1 PREDICTED: protection of telomeres protein 1a-like isoform X1 [Nicotiana attenuata]
MSQRRDDYTSIVEAMTLINQKVNLMGVVLETSFPRKTKGTDYFCLVKIIDQSYQSRGLSVNIFTETIEKLPWYSMLVILFCFLTLGERDEKLILGLRKWLVDHSIVADIREGDGFNLVCKILRVVREDEWILLVWDGTDTPPVAINARLEDELETPFPLESVPVCLPRDIFCKLPPLGTVLRVTLNCGNEKLAMNVLRTNRWVKFDNLRCQLLDSLWHAAHLPTTRFCYLRDEDHIVSQRMREYDKHIKSKWGMDASFSLTLANSCDSDRPFRSAFCLLDESSCASQGVIRLFLLLDLLLKGWKCP